MTASPATVPTLVLGGSGYVAGELLRLLAGHPVLRVAGVVSSTQGGELVERAFPHLAGCFPALRFTGRGSIGELVEALTPSPSPAGRGEQASSPIDFAMFSAAPHGASAPLVDEVLQRAQRLTLRARVVDLSADFRFGEAAAYERVYGHAHGARERLHDFTCVLPEHTTALPAAHVAHPGCFVTAVLLAAVPLLKLNLIEPTIYVSAVTGSTGAGRTPTSTTHHPERRSNLFAYQPLSHRHEPEMRALAAAGSGVEAEIHFVPHAGPFARGIHATLQARTTRPLATAEAQAALAAFYAQAPFVEVCQEAPRLQDVVGTNRCRLGVFTHDRALVALSTLDNLTKGAAGGGIQWMNRLLGLDETMGLRLPGLGWL
jgi:N-acetyl-gamma-glutamyl-phosphate reductase common form